MIWYTSNNNLLTRCSAQSRGAPIMRSWLYELLYPELLLVDNPAQRRRVLMLAGQRWEGRLWFYASIPFLITLAVVSGPLLSKWLIWISQVLSVPFWLTVLLQPLLVAIPTVLFYNYLFRNRIRRAIRRELAGLGMQICINCGYDLHGQIDLRCPECGAQFSCKDK